MGNGGVFGIIEMLNPLVIGNASDTDLALLLEPLDEASVAALTEAHPDEAIALRDAFAELLALKQVAEGRNGGDLDSARSRALAKMGGVSLFRERADLVGAIRTQLASDTTTDFDLAYRASTLHLSPRMGGGTIPIRHGVSQTVPLPNPPGPKVLFISLFPLGSNGSGTYTKAMAHHIAQRGGEVRILHLGHQFEEPGLDVPTYLVPFTPIRGEALEGAALANFPVLDSNPASPNGKRFQAMSIAEVAAYTEGLADAVAEAVRHMQPDILIINHAWLGAQAAQRTGLPYVVVCHGTCLANMQAALDPANGYPSNLAGLIVPAVQAADRVIAITEEVAGDLAQVYGLNGSRMTVIHNGFNSEIFNPQPDLDRHGVLARLGILNPEEVTHVVSFAGRMIVYKGITTLLEAAWLLQDAMPGVHFILAGDGAERAQLEARRDELGLTDRVHFIGHLPLAGAAELHRIADLGVVPSWQEPFGIVALEIAGVGTPVIASAVGGLQAIVTDEVGMQVPPQDAGQLADAIRMALDSDLKSQIGPKASHHVHRHYPWQTRGARLLTELQRVLDRRPSVRAQPAR